jgi:hypothetical protein
MRIFVEVFVVEQRRRVEQLVSSGASRPHADLRHSVGVGVLVPPVWL